MGGNYANDFNLFGRTWQVKIQADADERKKVDDIFRVRLRTVGRRSGAAAGGGRRRSSSPRPARSIRYNNLRSVTMQGAPAPGYLVRPGDRRHGEARQADPAGRLRLRMDRHGAAGEGGVAARPASSSALALVFAYLFLVGLYESSAIPVAALLSVDGRPVRRGAGAVHQPASTTTSSPRSASSC